MFTSVAETEGEFFAHIWQESPSNAAQLSEQLDFGEMKWWGESERKGGGTKAYQEEKKRCRASTRESVNDCLWVGGEIRRKKKRIAGEYETRKDRQRSENQFVCSPVGWHWLRPAFLPWPLCQSSQTGIYTHAQPHTHILGLSRAGVRLSPNYSNYLSSKHSLPLAASWDTGRGRMCRTENGEGEGKNPAEWSEGGGIGSLGEGGADDFM